MPRELPPELTLDDAVCLLTQATGALASITGIVANAIEDEDLRAEALDTVVDCLRVVERIGAGGYRTKAPQLH